MLSRGLCIARNDECLENAEIGNGRQNGQQEQSEPTGKGGLAQRDISGHAGTRRKVLNFAVVVAIAASGSRARLVAGWPGWH
jgi:hypothetical protein